MSYEALKQVIRPSELAARLGEHRGTVTNWGRRGIPAERVLDICRLTEWRITPHQLRPDIYPNPDDGLPLEPVEEGTH